MPALVLPVNPVLAYQWAKGMLTDADLIHRSDLNTARGAGLFIVSLRSPAEYRDCLAQARALAQGLCVVFRTQVPSLARYVQRRWHALPLHTDPDGARRYWVGAESTQAWLNRAGLAGLASGGHRTGR
jgi:hypothetical protein